MQSTRFLNMCASYCLTSPNQYYIYDGLRTIEDYKSVNDIAPKRRYVWGQRPDELIAMDRTDQSYPQQRYWFSQDFLGSTAAVRRDDGLQAILWTYGPYGTIASQGVFNSASTDDVQYRYTGQRYDEETGLYYYKNRYYSPELGRFLSRDPIGFSGGMNQVAYVGDNPANATDVLGLFGSGPVGDMFRTALAADRAFDSKALQSLGYGGRLFDNVRTTAGDARTTYSYYPSSSASKPTDESDSYSKKPDKQTTGATDEPACQNVDIFIGGLNQDLQAARSDVEFGMKGSGWGPLINNALAEGDVVFELNASDVTRGPEGMLVNDSAVTDTVEAVREEANAFDCLNVRMVTFSEGAGPGLGIANGIDDAMRGSIARVDLVDPYMQHGHNTINSSITGVTVYGSTTSSLGFPAFSSLGLFTHTVYDSSGVALVPKPYHYDHWQMDNWGGTYPFGDINHALGFPANTPWR